MREIRRNENPFMGDSGFTEEDLLLNEDFDLSCDILAVGHHGSKYSTGVRLLR